MFAYYTDLAVRSLRRHVALTALTIVAVAVGIGASMTVFTMFRALSGDPIPDKSSRLFITLIDNWGPNSSIPEQWRTRLSYIDAMALMRVKHGERRSAMYGTSVIVAPGEPAMPFSVSARAAYADLFPMFNVRFREGGPWSSSDDSGRTNVVVLSGRLADRLFQGQPAVNRQVMLNQQPYRVVGVLQEWNPQPRFYDLLASSEDIFLPLSTAIDRQLYPNDSPCNNAPAPGWSGLLSSECIWIGFWIELRDAAAVRSFQQFLQRYTAEQRQLGRFRWPPKHGLYDVREWLVRQKVVPDEVRMATFVAFGFLAVCLLNAVSLMLAKFAARVGNLSVHRALGASKMDVFAQCITETTIVGVAGGLLGLVLTVLGLKLERIVLRDDLDHLTQLDAGMVVITFSLAVIATVACGLYPSWRASRTPPALQLKVQ